MNAIMKQSGHTTYGVKEFVCDTAEDLQDLSIDVPMGTCALVIATGDVYMINSKHEWVKI